MEVRHAHKQRMKEICFISDLDGTLAKMPWFILYFLNERQARDTGARECFFFCFHNPKQSSTLR